MGQLLGVFGFGYDFGPQWAKYGSDQLTIRIRIRTQMVHLPHKLWEIYPIYSLKIFDSGLECVGRAEVSSWMHCNEFGHQRLNQVQSRVRPFPIQNRTQIDTKHEKFKIAFALPPSVSHQPEGVQIPCPTTPTFQPNGPTRRNKWECVPQCRYFVCLLGATSLQSINRRNLINNLGEFDMQWLSRGYELNYTTANQFNFWS